MQYAAHNTHAGACRDGRQGCATEATVEAEMVNT